MNVSKPKRPYLRIATTIIFLLFVITFAFSILSGRSIVILIQTLKFPATIAPAEAGKTVCVLKDLNFESGEWAAYIVTASSDLAGLPDGVPRHNFLKLTDKGILKEMQRDWCFEITGGDVATVESYIAILQNDELRWESGIVISPNYEGLQSAQFGWVKPKTKNLLAMYAKKFKSSILPIHVI